MGTIAAHRYGKTCWTPLGLDPVGRTRPALQAGPGKLSGCVSLLGLKPEEVMMVAAHISDLNAARSVGLQTGFIYRPKEYGPAKEADKAAPNQFDVVTRDMLDLATQLGA